ncbi:MAG: hypothetical protein M3Y87_02260 [Myxococcota bacterium]|nr:hypothetical protein [Myxococcota bacterium]
MSAQSLRPAVPTAPDAYRAPNLVPIEARAPTPAVTPIAAPSRPIDVAARFRDEFFGGLLGYGVGVGLAVLIAFVEPAGDDFQQPLLLGIFAPVGLAAGVWIGGLEHGGSRFDGAMIGTIVGTLLCAGAMAMLTPELDERSLEDPVIVSIGLLVPVIAAIAGAEIATAIGGGPRF